MHPTTTHGKSFVISLNRKRVISVRKLIYRISPNVPAPQQAEEWEKARSSVVREWRAWERTVLGFLKSHTRGTTYTLPDPKTDTTKFNAQIRFMIQLYFCLSKFVNFYPTFVESIAAREVPPTASLGQHVQGGQQGHRWPPLNGTELLRLQRGLLRYELHCRLVGLPSVALSCNPDAYEAVVLLRITSGPRDLWVGNPFCRFLPIDEVEETISASIYVMELYSSLRCSVFEDFCERIPDSNHGHNKGMLSNDDAEKTKKTASHWMRSSEGQILEFRSLPTYGIYEWRDTMSRLGLVFLHRMTTSTLAERTELMRSAVSNVLAPQLDPFLWLCWTDVVRKPRGHWNVSRVREVGPHCNPIIQACTRDAELTDLIDTTGIGDRLRSMGWVFFDDKLKLDYLDFPQHANSSSFEEWLTRIDWDLAEVSCLGSGIPDSASASRFTEEEWMEIIMERFSDKDYRDDYQAKCRFVARVRAVVDFTSTRLPQIN